MSGVHCADCAIASFEQSELNGCAVTLGFFFSWKFIVLYVLLFSTLYVHFRGKDRRPILRQIGDHNTLIAPYNLFMYWFSAVPAKPILNVSDFPELAGLRDNWHIIRDEAMQLLQHGADHSGDRAQRLRLQLVF
jgi:hypothetical protein